MPDAHQEFRELLDTFDNAMLVTRNVQGELRARPMAVASTERDGDLWFATSIDSGKVDEIRADDHVAVTLQGGGKFLSLSGTATVVVDRARIDALWSDAWKVWFPDGKESKDLGLIHVAAHHGEYWDYGAKETLRFLFEAGKALYAGEEIDAEALASEKVDLNA